MTSEDMSSGHTKQRRSGQRLCALVCSSRPLGHVQAGYRPRTQGYWRTCQRIDLKPDALQTLPLVGQSLQVLSETVRHSLHASALRGASTYSYHDRCRTSGDVQTPLFGSHQLKGAYSCPTRSLPFSESWIYFRLLANSESCKAFEGRKEPQSSLLPSQGARFPISSVSLPKLAWRGGRGNHSGGGKQPRFDGFARSLRPRVFCRSWCSMLEAESLDLVTSTSSPCMMISITTTT